MRTTLNDLKEINLNATILSENMTDAEWQDYFACMKMIITPVNEKQMKLHPCRSIYEDGVYKGDTQAMRYNQFINGILKTIRSGAVDYCY